MRFLLLFSLLFLLSGCGPDGSSPLLEEHNGSFSGTSLTEDETDRNHSEPAKTITFFIHGYHKEGADHQGVYGEPVLNDMLVKLRHYTRWPILEEDANEKYERTLAACWYYGDTPPSYYSAEDIREIDEITTRYGGGIPRYAAIIGKFIDHMMRETNASKANIVSVSMGSLVTRWLIEKDTAHLASEGKIARWLSLEGVIAGNYAASSNRLSSLVSQFDPQSIDVEQMRYDWIARQLHDPSHEGASPYYKNIVVAFESSTDDRLNDSGLSLLTKLNGGYRPNDGTQLVEDTYFHPMLPQARYRQLPPMHLFFHENHFSLESNDGAYASIVAFLRGSKRIRITLIEAKVEDIHEKRTLFFDNRPAEVVFASRIFSPLASRLWQTAGAIDERALKSGILPIHKYEHDHETRSFRQILFDSFVLPDEKSLVLDLHAYEIDFNERYHMQELTGHRDEDLQGARITLPLEPGIYDLDTPQWHAKIEVERVEY